jgi:phage head maturation protease
METEPDFSGYATKAGLTCSDGRVIMKDAFAHQDQTTVPLVWQHGHTDPKNVLGHAILENRADGVYARAFFNDTPEGQHVKTLVQHGDVVSLSIWANQLKERSKQVFHGMIRELSVVLSGANPGALIDQVRIEHSDGSVDTLEDEAIIFTGLELEHAVAAPDNVDATHAEGNPLGEILATLNEEQLNAVNFVLEAAIKDAKGGDVQHSETESEAAPADDETKTSEAAPADDEAATKAAADKVAADEEAAKAEADKTSEAAPADETKTSEAAPADETKTEDALAHTEGNTSMTKNVFDQSGAAGTEGATLTHDQFSAILADVKNFNGSLKESMLAHAGEYGITDINFLFPDAKALSNNPELNARRMEWVAKVLDNTKHTPFAKVKSIVADITAEEARARGYVKGTKKVDEVIQLLKRSTGPATIYKKQRLDRDDVLDITDMDVVAFLKAEMRIMIEEEIARAILVGDGRSPVSDDKVKDPAGALDGNGIRSILNDSDFYAVKHELVANIAPKEAVKGIVRARAKYRGTGKPTLFISDNFLTDIMLEEDKFGRPLYETEQSLSDKLRVESIVTVDLFDEYDSLFAIMVNLADYTIGANKGGELTNFEDFDIDFNQYKYLQETRLSGALTKPFSAVVVSRGVGTLVAPSAPSFVGGTNTLTVPVKAGITYELNGVAHAAGDVVITEDTEVVADANEGFYIAPNTTKSWTFTFTV